VSPDSSACTTRCNSGLLLVSAADTTDTSAHESRINLQQTQRSSPGLHIKSMILSVDGSVAQDSTRVQLQDCKHMADSAPAAKQQRKAPAAPAAAAASKAAAAAADIKACAGKRRAGVWAGAAVLHCPALVQGNAGVEPALAKKEKQVVGVHFTVQLGKRVPIVPTKVIKAVCSKNDPANVAAAAAVTNITVQTNIRAAKQAAAAAAMVANKAVCVDRCAAKKAAPLAAAAMAAKQAATVVSAAVPSRPILVRAAKQAAATKCKLAFGSRVDSRM
jgi:hypothetical protein